MSNKSPASQIRIACNPNAIPADKREQWIENGKQVYAAVQEVQGMWNGYSFRVPTDSATLLKVAEYIANERLCCPFLHFTVDIEPDGGPIWLRLTGGEEVKAYMRTVFESNHLLKDDVARARL